MTPEAFANFFLGLSNFTLTSSDTSDGETITNTEKYAGNESSGTSDESTDYCQVDANHIYIQELLSSGTYANEGLEDCTHLGLTTVFQVRRYYVLAWMTPSLNGGDLALVSDSAFKQSMHDIFARSSYRSSDHGYHLRLKGNYPHAKEPLTIDADLAFFCNNGVVTKMVMDGIDNNGCEVVRPHHNEAVFSAIGTTSVSIPEEAKAAMVYHKVSFKDVHGESLGYQYVPDGARFNFSGEMPSKAADGTSFYSFTGWTNQQEDVTADITVTPQFAKIDPTTTYAYDTATNTLTFNETIDTVGSIIVPDGTVTLILHNPAQDGELNFHSIVIPSSVTSITVGNSELPATNYAFDVTTKSNPNFTVIDHTLYSADKKTLYVHQSGTEESLTLPSETTSIQPLAFFQEGLLSSITFPEGLTSIGYGAFEGCPLVSLSLPKNLATIATHAFNNCEVLSEVTFAEDSVITTLDAIFAKDINLLSVTLPASLKTLADGCFHDCESLDNVDLSMTKITAIPQQCFLNNYSLTNITLPSGVTTIGDEAFINDNLQAFTIQSDMVLGLSAFANNPDIVFTNENLAKYLVTDGDLYSVPNPNSTTLLVMANKPVCTPLHNTNEIAAAAATGKNNLTTLDLSGVDVPIQIDATFEGSGLSAIAWPFYSGATVTLGNGFTNCASLKKIAIPSSVVFSSSTAEFFKGCQILESLDLSDSGITALGTQAFYGDYSLKSLTLPRKLTSIGENAFNYCYALTSLVIPASVTSIDSSAFKYTSTVSLYLEATSVPSTFTLGWDEDISAYYLFSASQPTTTPEKYWHYVDGVPTNWANS